MTPHPCPEERDPLAYCPVCAADERAAEARKEGDRDIDGRAADWEADRYERWMEGDA